MQSDSDRGKSATSRERREQVERIRLAAAEGVRAALRRHMLLGESVVVADDDGGVRWLGPEEIRRALDENFNADAKKPPAA